MEQGRIRREGLMTGAIGATAVAVWFFIVDMLAGHPLFTPYALGSVLQGSFGVTTPMSISATILLYTIFHYLAFMVVGVIASAVFNAAEHEPGFLVGFLVLFVGLEIICLGLTVMMDETSGLRQIAWYQIGAANLIASIAMGSYLIRHHRHLLPRAAQRLGGI